MQRISAPNPHGVQKSTRLLFKTFNNLLFFHNNKKTPQNKKEFIICSFILIEHRNLNKRNNPVLNGQKTCRDTLKRYG